MLRTTDTRTYCNLSRGGPKKIAPPQILRNPDTATYFTMVHILHDRLYIFQRTSCRAFLKELVLKRKI